MNEYDACETAYKNGYEQGKKDAVKHGRWINGLQCSECKSVDWTKPKFCSTCGCKMDAQEGANDATD